MYELPNRSGVLFRVSGELTVLMFIFSEAVGDDEDAAAAVCCVVGEPVLL